MYNSLSLYRIHALAVGGCTHDALDAATPSLDFFLRGLGSPDWHYMSPALVTVTQISVVYTTWATHVEMDAQRLCVCHEERWRRTNEEIDHENGLERKMKIMMMMKS